MFSLTKGFYERMASYTVNNCVCESSCARLTQSTVLCAGLSGASLDHVDTIASRRGVRGCLQTVRSKHGKALLAFKMEASRANCESLGDKNSGDRCTYQVPVRQSAVHNSRKSF
jgi:hypothetical protein